MIDKIKNLLLKRKEKTEMKDTLKNILLDALKRYLPLILNAICAGTCLTATGCVIAKNAGVNNFPPSEVTK